MTSGIRKVLTIAIAAVMFLSVMYGSDRMTETAQAAEIGSAEAEKYDPRTEYTSPVHDQWQWDTCWAMSGISTAESFLIRNSLADNSIFLSVEDVLWWVRGDGDSSGWTYQRRDDGRISDDGRRPEQCGYPRSDGTFGRRLLRLFVFRYREESEACELRYGAGPL